MLNKNLQSEFLDSKLKKHKKLKFYMINGFQLKGMVKDIGPYAILILKTDSKKEALVYKSAISTVEEM